MVYLSMERLGNQVTKLGYSMPSLTRKVDGLNDWRQILEKHVSTIRNEIHGMQIIGTHKINPSLVSDVAQDSGEILDVISALTQELVALQHRTAQLVTKKADMVGRLVAVMAGGSAFATTAVAESLVHQPSNVVYEESKNPVFALSKGALTVGELAMSSAMTTLPKSSDPTSVQSHNSASSGGWGTFGAATSQDSPPPPPFGANIANPPASSDPFGFSSLPAAPDAAAKVTGTQESVSTPAPVNDFSWGAFQ
ncbi:unnamed protein product [Peronospora belbahrii]|uniref:Nucleoporin NSP1-like C-terminal domain-containing protein n=1 Tax=Peronospora belbahrii TaxID=622444 RepID=A0AAU9L068_9STRA|nr:unnamed protein product [Peronospora belbahrii]CAH0520535.1 unnamed protein product [Peronospora belbahrii]